MMNCGYQLSAISYQLSVGKMACIQLNRYPRDKHRMTGAAACCRLILS
jgi:hypothetical protein